MEQTKTIKRLTALIYIPLIVLSGLSSLAYSFEFYDDLESRGEFMIATAISELIVGVLACSWSVYRKNPWLWLSAIFDAWFALSIGILLLDSSDEDQQVDSVAAWGIWLGFINVCAGSSIGCCSDLDLPKCTSPLIVLVSLVLYWISVTSLEEAPLYMLIVSIIVMVALCGVMCTEFYEDPEHLKTEEEEDENYGAVPMHNREKDRW